MKIAHDYREFDGIAHNLKLLADQVQDGNFTFAARSFKLPAEFRGSSRYRAFHLSRRSGPEAPDNLLTRSTKGSRTCISGRYPLRVFRNA